MISALADFFLRFVDTHQGMIQSSHADDHCFRDVYVGKQPLAWKVYCVETLGKLYNLNNVENCIKVQ